MFKYKHSFHIQAILFVCMMHVAIFYLLLKNDNREFVEVVVTWVDVLNVPGSRPSLPSVVKKSKTNLLKLEMKKNHEKIFSVIAPSEFKESLGEKNIPLERQDAVGFISKVEPEIENLESQISRPESGPSSSSIELVENARKMAGKIDRDFRQKKLAPMENTDSDFNRFKKAVENAYIDRSTYERRSFMELPDGTTYYSFTRGGKTECFMTGKIDSAGKGGGGSPITCPSKLSRWSEF